MTSDIRAPLGEVVTGEHGGETSAHQLPDINASMVWLEASSDNAGSVFVGPSTVVKHTGDDSLVAGWELAPGKSLGPLPLDNLNRLYIICDNAGDDLLYLIMR